MKKIGFITIQQANFGSVLQTFATSFILKKMGYHPVLIDYQYPTDYHRKNAMGREAKRYVAPLIKRLWKNVFKYTYRLLHGMPIGQSSYQNWVNQKTNKKFLQFQSQIEKTNVSYDMVSIIENPPVFDIYMTGSDQTWNPRYYANDYSFLLNFAPDDKPKIAYAASYGTSEFYPQYAVDYAKYLKRYDAISTRESTGVRITKELAGIKAVHCCDPTLLLTKEEWMKFAVKENPIKEKYVLVYIQAYAINPYPYADKLVRRVKKIVGAKKVVVLNSEIYEIAKGFKPMIGAGPSDFLRLFADASFIICCSFHSVAFSINFRKPFYAIAGDVPTKDNRQSDIIDTLGLQSRVKTVGDKLPNSFEELVLDYTPYEDRIEKFRKQSFEYLKKVLA